MPPAFALSQDQTLRFISTPSHTAKAVQPAISTNRASTHLSQDPSISQPLFRTTYRLTSVTVTHQKDTTATPHTQATGQQSLIEPSTTNPGNPTQSHSRDPAQDAADVSLPQPIHLSKSQSRKHQTPAQGGQSGQLALLCTPSGADREG